MNTKEKLVLIGDGEFAQLAYEYFTEDSPFEVVAFCAEKEFIRQDKLYGLPVVPFEKLESFYRPEEYKVFTAITYTRLNRVRTKLYRKAKEKGFRFASYISSKAFVWKNAQIGENCFIFEDNVIQRNVEIGNNVIIWSGSHVGHLSRIKDNCFLSAQVAVAGRCEVEENCFLGINSTTADNITIARDNFIGAGAVVLKNTEQGRIYQGNPAEAAKIDSLKFFKVKEEAILSF